MHTGTHTHTHSRLDIIALPCGAEPVEGSVTPQRLCDSPPITQSPPHLISPVNERLSVSRAAIGRWAPSVTVSGKCRSMGSAENGVLQTWSHSSAVTHRCWQMPPRTEPAWLSSCATWTHRRRGNKNMTQGATPQSR